MARVKVAINIGEVFGKLTVIGDPIKGHDTKYLCRCECGVEKRVIGRHLLIGSSKSCGKGSCRDKTKVGTHKLADHTIVKTLYGMRTRCKIATGRNSCYKDISVCDEWIEDVMSFYNWSINNGWKEGLSIDRIDSNKGYSPANCRWVDDITQSQNRGVSKASTTGIKGIYKVTKYDKYYTVIIYKGSRHTSKWFNTKEEAYKYRVDYIQKNDLINKVVI